MKNSIYLLLLVLALSACTKDDPVIQETVPSGPELPPEFAAFANIFDGNGVGAAINLTEDIVILFNQNGNRYAWFEEGEVHAVRDFSDPLSHFDDDFQFNAVGAATLLNNTTAYFFSVEGDQYTTASFNAADADEGWNNSNLLTFSSTVHDLTEWGPDNTCPFQAIGAAWPWTDPNTDCFDATLDDDWIHMVNKFGDEYVYYESPNGGSFEAAEELENWTATNNCNGPDGLIPFDTIGAVFRYISPNKIEEIIFSEDGSQFCFYAVSEGVFSEVYNIN